MAQPKSELFAALTRKLLPDTALIDKRLQLSRDFQPNAPAGEGLNACRGWKPLREVLLRAINEQRPTLIYGDYDVDGAVATFLLHRFLRSRQVPGNYFLPSRLKHGYGLDREIVEQAVQHGYKTIIAVDCGIANAAEVGIALAAGVDVGIIDHHELRGEPPDAPCLNPHLEDSLAPYCAAGLVYQVLGALREERNEPAEPDEHELAGLATLADIVPLVPDNWILAHHGLRALPETCNLGLQQLIKVSRLHGLTRLTARQALFNLVPRLNAAGRIRNARMVVDLLDADSADRALDLALQLDRINEERKQIVDKATRSALIQASAEEREAAVAVYDPDWHIGVLGIAAARVAELLSMPAIVLTDSPKDKQLLSGSARSYGGFDIVRILGRCADTVEDFGGHAAAAGLHVRKERLAEFRQAWAKEVAAETPEEANLGQLCPVELHELNEQFERDMWQLAPFGPGYPAPTCVLSGCVVERASYMGRDKTHLNLQVTDGTRQVSIAGFSQSHLYDLVKPGAAIEPIVEIEPDNYNNRYSIMLRLLGLADQHAK